MKIDAHARRIAVEAVAADAAILPGIPTIHNSDACSPERVYKSVLLTYELINFTGWRKQ
jgi:hypothetical protein